MFVSSFVTNTDPDSSYITFVFFLRNCWFELCLVYHKECRCFACGACSQKGIPKFYFFGYSILLALFLKRGSNVLSFPWKEIWGVKAPQWVSIVVWTVALVNILVITSLREAIH